MAGIVRNLMVRAVADFSGLERSMHQAQRDTSNFARSMEKAFSGLKSKLALLGGALIGGEAIKSAISDAIELEATTANLQHILGSSAQEYINWSQTVATSYGYSQLEAEKYGASFAHMISLFAHGSQDITKKTEDLMKTSAIIANGTGRSIDDVMQRIQSGMLGNVQAINDLGVYANQSMLEMSQGFKEVAHGRHWADLTMAERQQVIYMSIMEQASKQYGNTLENNVHRKLVTFTATLKNLRVGLGNAFLPILNRVLPILTALAQKLVVVVGYVDQFMQALFGGHHATAKASDTAAASTNRQTSAVNNLGNAVKNLTKAKKAAAEGGVAGFDQVHTLNSSSADDSGADSGGGTGMTLTPPDTSGFEDSINNITDTVNKLTQSVKDFADEVKAWLSPLKPYWDDLVTAVGNFGQAVANLWGNSKFQAFIGWLANAFQIQVETWMSQITDTINVITDIVKIITDLLNGDFKSAWNDVVDLVNNFVGAITGHTATEWYTLIIQPIINAITSGKSLVGNKAAEVWSWIISPYAGAYLWFRDNLWGKITEAADNVKTIISKKASTVWGWITGAFADVQTWFKTNVTDKITGVFTGMGNLGDNVWSKVESGWGDIKKWVKTNVTDKIYQAFTAMGTLGDNVWGKVKSGWGDIKKWFKTYVTDKIYQAFTGMGNLGDNVWSKVKSGWGDINKWFKTNIISKITNTFTTMGNLGDNIWGKIKSGYGDVKTWFTNNIVKPINTALQGVTSSFSSGIYNSIKALLNTLIDWINKPLKSIKGYSVFGQKPFSGLGTIPHLAKGGITNGPMLAMIGDNPGGQEVVSPLDKLQGIVGTAVMQAMQFNKSSNNSVGGDIILNVDGKTFARIIKPYMDKETKRVGNNVRLKSV